MAGSQTHKNLATGHEIKTGSDRNFGYVFAVVFALIGVWPALAFAWPPRFDPSALRWWALVIAALFLATALIRPALLHPLNRLWHRFGLLLSKVVTPVVMGLLFIVTVVPTALILRLRGRDLLRLKFDPQAKSYWIIREPPGPPGDTMKNQY
jgi:cytochrome c oxidase subunit IV